MTSRKGTQRELYIAKKFGKEGYVTVRKYASLGSYDFIAFRKAECQGSFFGHCHSEMLCIQVKGTPWEFTEIDKAELLKDSAHVGARPVLVYRETRKTKLGLTKEGNQRTIAKWITVYLDEQDEEKIKKIKRRKKLTASVST